MEFFVIIDFTITNFRSFRDEQTLSYYVEKSSSSYLAKNFQHPVEGIGVLATAAIYGPNASGKSNILRALEAFSWLVSESHTFKEGSAIPTYEPYRLLAESRSAPIKFELEFVVDGLRYLYEIRFTKKEITYEKLSFYSVGAQRTVLSRLYERKNGDWNAMSFGAYFTGGTRKFPLFKNRAYLSVAGNAPDAPEFIRKIYQFFAQGIYFIKQDNFQIESSWKKNDKLVGSIASFLSALDSGITNIRIKSRPVENIHQHFPSGLPEHIKDEIIEDLTHVPYFEHPCEDGGTQEFALDDESDGIRSLVKSLPLIMQVIKTGRLLVWDELETSLHPHIAELVVDLFNNPEINKKQAQLLFTTHNLALMNSDKMRKDQLWLVEKHGGASQLISLDEFESSQLKHSSPFAKWYYDGRLGGLPVINQQAILQLFMDLDKEEVNGQTP